MTDDHATRLHALDNLRALMMWLGIVIHGSAYYLVRESPMPWRDGNTTQLADFLLAFVHAFRMPVFFVLAGFFVALLLRSRGAAGMARHRAKRLGLPFIVFWPPVVVASVVLGLLYVHQMALGTWGLDPSLFERYAHKPGQPELPRTPNTLHLWFLWMLLWMSLATALLARFVPARHWEPPARVVRRIVAAWWGPLVLTVPLLICDVGYPQGFMFPSGAFLPPVAEWLHHGVYFAAGLAMYGARVELFAHYERRWAAYAVAGFASFVVAGYANEHERAAMLAYSYGLTGWLWTFALLGAALRWMPSRNAALAYLSESSYWVYLVHFPLTVGFGALLYVVDLPGAVKLLANITATTLVCLATYHAFVRFTWVSVLLNGTRHPRPQGPAVPRAA